MEQFENRDIQQILRLTRSQIIHWTKECRITPEYQDAKGTGSSRVYSIKNLFDLALIKYFLKSGYSLNEIRGYYFAFDYVHVDIWREGLPDYPLNAHISKTKIEFGTSRRETPFSIVKRASYGKYYNEIQEDSKTLLIPDVSCAIGSRRYRLLFSPTRRNNILGIIKDPQVVTIFMSTKITLAEEVDWLDSMFLVNVKKIKESVLNNIK